MPSRSFETRIFKGRVPQYGPHSVQKTHGFVLGSHLLGIALCAMVEETAREALSFLVAKLIRQANAPDRIFTKQYGEFRVLNGKVLYCDDTKKAVAAEVKRLIEASRTQRIQDEMIKAAPGPTKMRQTTKRTAPQFQQGSPVQPASMTSGPLKRWTSAASLNPNAVGSNGWARILAGLALRKTCLCVHMSSADDHDER